MHQAEEIAVGWTFLPKPDQVKGYLEGLGTFTGADGRVRRVIASALVQRVEWYAAMEIVGPGPRREVVGLVFLIKFVPKAPDGYTFGYKDMSETMGRSSVVARSTSSTS
ncbi:MAG: hypothetical protein EA356_00940 [Geminicoccaceae bacterium]|nr:MAG: hypothetical protein EA356_00940 [Geminicoccaceae bacterium]